MLLRHKTRVRKVANVLLLEFFKQSEWETFMYQIGDQSVWMDKARCAYYRNEMADLLRSYGCTEFVIRTCFQKDSKHGTRS